MSAVITYAVPAALVAVTAFLFGLVEYRRHSFDQFDLDRAVTRVLEVVAIAFAIVTAVVLVVRVAGALL